MDIKVLSDWRQQYKDTDIFLLYFSASDCALEEIYYQGPFDLWLHISACVLNYCRWRQCVHLKKKFIVHRVTLSGINRKHTKKRNKTTLEPPYYLQNPYNCMKYIMQNGFSVGLYTYLYVSMTGTLVS